jgi:hypothetical protein
MITRVSNNAPYFTGLSTDIVDNTFSGALSFLGARFFAIDTGNWYVIKSDGTLGAYSSGSTTSVIKDSNGNELNVSGDGQAWVRAREYGDYAVRTVSFSGLPADGGTFILSDGISTVTFEFDSSSNGVSGDNVAVVFNPVGTVSAFLAIFQPIITSNIASELLSMTSALSGDNGLIFTSTLYGSLGVINISGTGTNMVINPQEAGLDDVSLRTLQETFETSSIVTQTIAINTAVATTAFDMSKKIGGMVITPTAWTAANIGFYVCDTLAGTYVIAKDKTGVPIQISTVATGAAGAYAIPTEIFTAKFVKVWSKNATAATETDINQAAERVLKVMLK